MNSQTQTRPKGSVLTAIGLGVVILGVILGVLAAVSGGAPTGGTFSVILIGLVLAAIGFAARVLAALERR